MGRARLGLAVVLAAACGGDEPVAAVDPLPTCGTDGPHRVLALAADQIVGAVDRLPDTDRLLLTLDDSTLVSVGPCGEDPVEIAVGVEVLETAASPMLGCVQDTGEVVVLSPNGATSAKPAMAGVGCAAGLTPEGLVGVEHEGLAAWGRLVIDRAPDDGALVPEVLLDEVRVPRTRGPPPPLWHGEGELLALTRDGALAQVDLASGEHERLIEPVADFRVSRDGRFVVWQAGMPTPDGVTEVTSSLSIRDRETGADTMVGDAYLGWTHSPSFGEFLAVRLAATGSERVFRVPSLDDVALPDGAVFRGAAPDGLVWFGGAGDWRAIAEQVYDPDRDTTALLYEGPGYAFGSADGLEVFVPDPDGGLQSGVLLLVPWAGGEPATLAEAVHFQRVRLADGRVLSVVEDEDRHGPLFVHEPGTGERTLIDEDVYVYAPQLNRGDPFDGDILYTVSDGERSGVWRIRLPTE